MLISFVWGVAAFGDAVSAPIAAGGLMLIVIGVCVIAGCGEIAIRVCGPDESVESMNTKLLDNGSGIITPAHTRSRTGGSVDLDPQLVHPAIQRAKMQSAAMPPGPHLSSASSSDMNGNGAYINGAHNDFEARFQDANMHVDIQHDDWNRHDSPGLDDTPEGTTLKRQRQLYGCVCALIVGVFGGSILMPLQLAPSAYRGLQFVPSFGLGTLLVAPLITLPYMWLSRSSGSRGNWAVKQSLLPGLLAGAMWNGANICSIYAIPKIGFAIAQPLMQCAIAVAAIWGVAVFKEIRGKQITVMAVGAVTVLSGAVLLALSKK